MNDPLHDIHHYSPTFTIAQIIKFCEKKGLEVSRAMIQNYIRAGLLSPPANRLYTQKHLAALVVILRFKSLFDIQTIKQVLAPHMDEEGLPIETYKWLVEKQKYVMELWAEKIAPVIAAEPEDRQHLLLMAHIADINDLKE
ncbi:MAG: DUF1836 domain-containing protein [Defluviitaleaceae bacterium]|nr:DUF1836 domain-containing protein [Defluviitaleaceae bacterium]